SRCTPSRDTSGPAPLPPVTAILSISSMKMMPVCSARRSASAVTSSMSMSFWASSCCRIWRASATRILRFRYRFGNSPPKRSWRLTPICSMPWPENTSMMGGRVSSTSISTHSFSSSPASRRARSASRAPGLGRPLVKLRVALPRRGRHAEQDRERVDGPLAPGERGHVVQEALVGHLPGPVEHPLHALRLDHAHGRLHQVPYHGVHVAADVAHLCKLGGFYLHKRRPCQPRQAPGDFGLAHAGWPDHQDVFRADLVPQRLRQLLPAPAVAQGDGHSPLGLFLSHDVFVKLGDDLPGRQVHQTSSTTTLSLV